MDDNSKNQIWKDVLENIKISVSSAIFSTWFSQTHISEVSQKDSRYKIIIGCASSFVKATIESRYFGLVQDSMSKLLDAPVDLLFVVKQEQKSPSVTNPDKEIPLFDQKDSISKDTSELQIKARLNPYFTFDNYAVSTSNQMAWAASDAVSKNLASAYNPLFIWGGVGVGKTHIMTAVGHEIIKKSVTENILFCTGEEFTNDIVEGIRNKTTQSFRNKYRKLRLLMLDDIQFIAGKDAVQEEFFHTFNSIVSTGGQIILTSDRPPSEITKLEERLKSRFEAGLIVDISEPDFELRCAIIQIKSKQKGMDLDNEIVQLIAGNIDAPRKIEGFLTKLLSESFGKKNMISYEFTETIIKKGSGEEVTKLKAHPDQVINAVSKYYSLGKRALLGKSRSRPNAHPRQILMYILRTQLSLPLEEVGRIVGDRDHTTVMHAVDKITNLAKGSVDVREDIRGIKNMF